jgi:nucleoside-diphosphate-sugar epimerase
VSAPAEGPVAVTGATGFLGGHICDALLDAGHRVRGVVRDPGRGARLRARGVGFARADLADEAALRAGLAGCTALVANAALGSWAGPLERYLDVNVGGTERLLRAAAAEGCAGWCWCPRSRSTGRACAPGWTRAPPSTGIPGAGSTRATSRRTGATP